MSEDTIIYVALPRCCFAFIGFTAPGFSFLPFASLQQQANFPTGINKLSCYLDVKYKQASVRK